MLPQIVQQAKAAYTAVAAKINLDTLLGYFKDRLAVRAPTSGKRWQNTLSFYNGDENIDEVRVHGVAVIHRGRRSRLGVHRQAEAVRGRA
jgi:hypothetical protein